MSKKSTEQATTVSLHHNQPIRAQFRCGTGSSVMFVYDVYFPYISVNFHSNENPITDSCSSLKILLENYFPRMEHDETYLKITF